ASGMWAVIDAAVLRPLPYPDDRTIVVVLERHPHRELTLATAQTASGSLVLTMPHFSFYSDLATNVHDALITAATARRARQPELFTAGAEKACFDGLSAADRDGWKRAVDYYTAGASTRFQRVLQRLELAGLVQRDGVRDTSSRQFLKEAATVRDTATPAYRQCRWPAEDTVN